MQRILVQPLRAGPDRNKCIVVRGVVVDAMDVQVGRVRGAHSGHGASLIIRLQPVLDQQAHAIARSGREEGTGKAAIVQPSDQPDSERQVHDALGDLQRARQLTVA
eukprot:5978624-Prymnesium_polylepis.2